VVRLWHAGSGLATGALTGHAGGVLALSWSPNGLHLASGGWDETVRVWRLAERTPMEVRVAEARRERERREKE
jgi:WD40 repeat protein